MHNTTITYKKNHKKLVTKKIQIIFLAKKITKLLSSWLDPG